MKKINLTEEEREIIKQRLDNLQITDHMNEFYNLVECMRTAQKAYFKAKPQTMEKRDYLKDSIDLEKKVDAEIAAFKNK